MKNQHPLTADPDPVENAVLHTAEMIHVALLWHDGQLHAGLGHQDDPEYWARRTVGVLLKHGWTHRMIADPTAEPCRAVPDVVLRREVCQAHGVGWPCAEPAELEREVRVMRGRILAADDQAGLPAGSVVVYSTRRCTPCHFDVHNNQPSWHTWAEREDIDHAAATGQPDPSTSRCGCYCAVVAEGATS